MTETLYSHESQALSKNYSIQDRNYNKQLLQDCPLCEQPSMSILINNALYHKYLDSQCVNYLTHVDNILDDQICPETVKYKQMALSDDHEQFMRRFYNLQEYQYKNKAIVEYYKFHKDYPKIHIKGISSAMDKFYERKKEFEYKKIKRILKQEQNISITTQKSSEIFSDIQEDDKKSRYSNVLNDLTQNNSQFFNQETNESIVWKNLCHKIDKAFQNKTLSPINFKKKSIFDQPEQKQLAQTKNFVNYLKKQQQKKDKEERYKNFVRSNKQSRYNSIQQIQSKQYASGATADSNYIKKFAKKQKSKPINSFKGSSAFYDGKIFYNPKASSGSLSTKDQKTKQQSHTPSHENFDLQYHFAQNGFKKNKEPYSNYGSMKRQESEGVQYERDGNKNRADNILENFKSRTNLKTTEDIYKNATQQMKLKKRSISYNSLANTNISSKRSSINILALREKDLEIKNRVSSQGGKLFKEKNGLINQINQRKSSQNQAKYQRAKSSGNFRTSRSLPKSLQCELAQQSKLGLNLYKKICVPKQVVHSLKGKSYSASKLKTGSIKYTTESKQRSNEEIKGQVQKQVSKDKRKDLNLFIENGLKNNKQPKDMFYSHQSSNAINIEKFLNTKLIGKGQTQKLQKHKILI